jgi:predicted DNA binding CopG/RHH family protein
MNTKIKLDSFERQIERSAASYHPVSKKERRKVEAILSRVRKSRSVNIRIAEHVLEELKRRSHREGLPYQTLISSILHKYVTDRLVDEDAIRKSLRLLKR